MGPRGLGAASGGGSGSMWRTDTARLLSVSLNTSSGLDSSPWVLEGWAEMHITDLHVHFQRLRAPTVVAFQQRNTLSAATTDSTKEEQVVRVIS